MRNPVRFLCVALVVVGGCIGQASHASTDYWMVASGQGGCAAVTTIAGDLSDLAPWRGPEDFVNGLRAKGLQVSTVTGEYQGRYLVKVVVPERKVDVVFVPYSLCQVMWREEIERYGRSAVKPKS